MRYNRSLDCLYLTHLACNLRYCLVSNSGDTSAAAISTGVAYMLLSLKNIEIVYLWQHPLGEDRLWEGRPVDIEVKRLAHSLTQPHQRILDLAPLLSLDHRCTMPGSCIERRLVCKVFLLYLRMSRGVRAQQKTQLPMR